MRPEKQPARGEACEHCGAQRTPEREINQSDRHGGAWVCLRCHWKAPKEPADAS